MFSNGMIRRYFHLCNRCTTEFAHYWYQAPTLPDDHGPILTPAPPVEPAATRWLPDRIEDLE